MKTVTQYTALIRLTAQMREQERIPVPERKEVREGSSLDIDHIYALESKCHVFP